MLLSLSATEVSFLMLAVIQAVASLVWALAAWAVPDARRAAAHWAAWSGLSATTWVVLSMQLQLQLQSPPLLGVFCGVLGVIMLQRGIRIYIGKPPRWQMPLALLLLVVVTDRLTGPSTYRQLQPMVNFGVLAWLYFGTAVDLRAHGRDELRLRWPVLLALPVLLGGAAYLSRALRAALSPESVLAEMTTNSSLNVGAALSFLVLVLCLHATLLALVVARLVTGLRRLARRDGLTGLLNRRAIEEALDAQMQRSQRSDQVFTLMMLDLDHFKVINDRHGHAMGDHALKHVAALLHGELRNVDLLGRYGGEEFLFLLPGLHLAQALPVAERLREGIAARPLVLAGVTVPLSVSIGVAESAGTQADPRSVLARADAALYRAKAEGRNRVLADDAPRTVRP
ncbi:GGDEF domain-containing protein [Rhodoferax sp.]|uniref:GGDEF domain-containing protein n=1 Tax=Rhodoferax sp. TaxID=50421 RepID=UPI001EB4DCF9|nr:GGDEF domain-containing protein [Rhodoferax sp.]MBT9508174.1 GGDEF domain-containing protein [Rhodoferax sp.]